MGWGVWSGEVGSAVLLGSSPQIVKVLAPFSSILWLPEAFCCVANTRVIKPWWNAASHSPSAGLVNAFSNKVSGEGFFKLPPVLKGVVDLGIGHAPTLEPAIKNLRHTVQGTLPQAGRDRQVVDTMEVREQVLLVLRRTGTSRFCTKPRRAAHHNSDHTQGPALTFPCGDLRP